MRPLPGILILLLMLTACTAPVPLTTVPTVAATLESHAVVLDGTLQTSLLAVLSKSSPRDNVLVPLDPARGIALPGYAPISLGNTYFHAFSTDHHTLAVVSFPSDDTYNGSLLFIDLLTWKTRSFKLNLTGWVSAMTFSPDGKQLAIAHGDFKHQLMTVNVENGAILAQSQTGALVTRLRFTRDGAALMLYGQNLATNVGAGPPQVFLLDAKDLSPRWSAELKEVREGLFPKDETITQTELYQPGNAFSLSPGLAFATDQDRLYIAHADDEKLTIVDFDTHKVETVEIQARLSGFGRLLALTADVAHAKGEDGTDKQAVVSPDGKFLYVIGVHHAFSQDQSGNVQFERTPLGLEILRTSDGSRVTHFETDASELSISHDGRFLYMRNWEDTTPWTEIFDTSKQQIVAHKDALYATPALLMNGKFLLVSAYTTSETAYPMSVLEPDGSRTLAQWTSKDYVSWLTP